MNSYKKWEAGEFVPTEKEIAKQQEKNQARYDKMHANQLLQQAIFHASRANNNEGLSEDQTRHFENAPFAKNVNAKHSHAQNAQDFAKEAFALVGVSDVKIQTEMGERTAAEKLVEELTTIENSDEKPKVLTLKTGKKRSIANAEITHEIRENWTKPAN